MEINIINAPGIVLGSMAVIPGMTTVMDLHTKSVFLDLETAYKDRQVVVFALIRPEYRNSWDKGGSAVSIMKLCRYAVTGKIVSLQKISDDSMRVTAEGIERMEIMALDGNIFTLQESPMELMFPDESDDMKNQALRDYLEECFADCLDVFPKQSGANNLKGLINRNVPVGIFMNAVVFKLPFKTDKKYEFIEITGIYERIYHLIGMLNEQKEMLQIKAEISSKVKGKIDKNQRNYVLREQMKTIQTELDENGEESDQAELENKINALKVSETIRDKIKKELRKLSAMPFGSQEGTVLRGHLEALSDMPWDFVTDENTDIKNAQKILNDDHYGLEKVKERILEYLAVRNLKGAGEGTVLCLVGPPGTGKTSIARSVARALNRKYVRISLGGVHDEADIRGHRKTYIGAMPGRIANALRQAGSSNPVVLLDELDKLDNDHRGDPAAALLEVLDTEQNMEFRDHYLEIPINLSDCIFIATANDASRIPAPLRDRVEMIQVDSYTANEKMHIALKYLIKKQMEKHGLTSDSLTITEGAVDVLIHSYTREAGVRELERKIGALCRKTARIILEEQVSRVTVDSGDVEKFLGKPLYKEDDINHESQVGIVHGLAWTSAGGDTLEIEVNVMPGKGGLMLTGKLGDVMKESAQTALSYVRSISEHYSIDDQYYEKHDIHVHVPEGAVPKDGPSAGVTIATAMFSAVTNKPVKGDVAMTGEVTLRGNVLPIGGLKEKLLAAGDAGMKKVIVPAANEPDVSELSEEITAPLEICFVKDMSDILEEALL